MEKTVKEIIEENLRQYKYNEKEINNILKKLETSTLEESNLLSTILSRRLKNKDIIYLIDFFKLEIKKAEKTMNLTPQITEKFLITISKKIGLLINQKNQETETEQIGKIVHQELQNLIENITNNKVLNEILKEEIMYTQSLELKKDQNIKTWKYSRHFLTKKEISLLRKYLQKNINLSEIEDSVNKANIYASIIDIYNNLSMYINRLNYKYILNNNYYELESIDLEQSTIKVLKRNNIFLVSELIEYTNEELQKIKALGPAKYNNIIEKLKEKNIIMLEEKEKLIENLQKENANIKQKSKEKTI